jgi:hypothetical protein
MATPTPTLNVLVFQHIAPAESLNHKLAARRA